MDGMSNQKTLLARHEPVDATFFGRATSVAAEKSETYHSIYSSPNLVRMATSFVEKEKDTERLKALIAEYFTKMDDQVNKGTNRVTEVRELMQGKDIVPGLFEARFLGIPPDPKS